MCKGKNKKNAKQNNSSKPLQSVNINLSGNMSAEEIQHIFACAIVEAEEIKKRKAQELEEEKRLKWLKSIGYKDFPNINCKLLKIIKIFFNKCHMFFSIMFISKKKISGKSASVAFLQEILVVFFGFLQILSLLLFIGCIVSIFCPRILPVLSLRNYGIKLYIFFALSFLLLSCVFRLIRIEIDKLDDYNYLFGLFTSISSLVAIIVAVIALIKET